MYMVRPRSIRKPDRIVIKLVVCQIALQYWPEAKSIKDRDSETYLASDNIYPYVEFGDANTGTLNHSQVIM